MEHEQLPYEEQVLSICPCGAPLYPVLNEEGERIGTHETVEDDDYHFQFFSSLRVELGYR